MTATYNARPGAKPGTTARARYVRMSATKARVVLDLIRGVEVRRAEEILRFCERDAAIVIGKLLRSAVANAEHNDDQIGDDLVVSACFADEGRTIRRFRPRAKGRATRIRKRTCHITIVVSRMTEEQLERRRIQQAARPASRSARRPGSEAAEPQAGRSRRRRSRKQGGEGSSASTPTVAPPPSEPEAPAATAEEAPTVSAPSEPAEAPADTVTPASDAPEQAPDQEEDR